jgi:hypothetical protein
MISAPYMQLKQYFLSRTTKMISIVCILWHSSSRGCFQVKSANTGNGVRTKHQQPASASLFFPPATTPAGIAASSTSLSRFLILRCESGRPRRRHNCTAEDMLQLDRATTGRPGHQAWQHLGTAFVNAGAWWWSGLWLPAREIVETVVVLSLAGSAVVAPMPETPETDAEQAALRTPSVGPVVRGCEARGGKVARRSAPRATWSQIARWVHLGVAARIALA